MTLTLLGEVCALASESGDTDWLDAALDDPVVYAPHTPYWSNLVADASGHPACCRFATNAPIHRADMVAAFGAVLPLLSSGAA